MTSPIARPAQDEQPDLMAQSLASVPVSSFSITDPNTNYGPPPDDPSDGVDAVQTGNSAVDAVNAAMHRRGSHSADVQGLGSVIGTVMDVQMPWHASPARNEPAN
jgi:hypothetical protein